MTIAAAAINNLNNIDTMLPQNNIESSDVDFSLILNEKIDDTDKLAEFKEFLNETISEANVETSLDLTLTKDITEKLETEEESETETENDNNVILFAQALEFANNQTITPEIQNTPIEVSKLIETAPEIETTPKTETTEQTETHLDENMLKELNIEKIEAETETSSDNSSLMNRQSPEEQGIKIMLHQDGVGVNESGKTFEAQTTAPSTKPTEVTPSKIIEQVTKHIETLQNNSKVSMVLNPESLGKITIQLVKSPEGLSAQFTATTQEAKNILMKGLEGLKETLTAHGIGVDNVSIKVSDTQKSEYNPDWTEQDGSRGGNKEQNPKNRQEKNKGLFEKTIAQQKENGKV